MMEAELVDNLRSVFSSYADASKLSPSTVWMRAAKDARFMSRIESGSGFTVKTYDSVMRWFSENWPDGATWPKTVSRPVMHSDKAA